MVGVALSVWRNRETIIGTVVDRGSEGEKEADKGSRLKFMDKASFEHV